MNSPRTLRGSFTVNGGIKQKNEQKRSVDIPVVYLFARFSPFSKHYERNKIALVRKKNLRPGFSIRIQTL